MAEDDLFALDDMFTAGAGLTPDAAADAIDDFTSLFTPVSASPSNPCFPNSLLSVPKLSVPTLASAAPSKPKSASLPRKPTIVKTEFSSAREYRQEVAIPRYQDKRKRRKWTHGLMHPSRSLAAHRRPRNGGKFDSVNAKFVSSTELGSL